MGSTTLEQYEADNTYKEAVEIAKEYTQPNEISVYVKDGKEMHIFKYANGNIVIREESSGLRKLHTDGPPTIEVQPNKKAGEKKAHKTRLNGNTEVEL
ncbi:MAG TPA: hypothetical protein VGW78_02390 [Candidatus Babeliales bacterium]|jgi:hypothetical protein|nr:hypothetical protein [Candidatus Babeliales bacterium]